jgi:ketosteroid isomerase-like protein
VRRSLSAIALLLVCFGAAAQQPSLRDEVAAADRAMFDAYNAHDIEKLMSFFAKDVEMYHDTGGLLSYTDAWNGMKSNFDKNNGIRRELVGDIEVYPIRGYGAIEIGKHRFCHRENGKDDCGTFKFLHVWQKKDGAWKITRAVSYDH